MSCENSDISGPDHFTDVSKTIKMPIYDYANSKKHPWKIIPGVMP